MPAITAELVTQFCENKHMNGVIKAKPRMLVGGSAQSIMVPIDLVELDVWEKAQGFNELVSRAWCCQVRTKLIHNIGGQQQRRHFRQMLIACWLLLSAGVDSHGGKGGGGGGGRNGRCGAEVVGQRGGIAPQRHPEAHTVRPQLSHAISVAAAAAPDGDMQHIRRDAGKGELEALRAHEDSQRLRSCLARWSLRMTFILVLALSSSAVTCFAVS